GLKFTPEVQFSCPVCGALINQSALKCPGCGNLVTQSSVFRSLRTVKKAPEEKVEPKPELEKMTMVEAEEPEKEIIEEPIKEKIEAPQLQQPMPGMVNGLSKSAALKPESPRAAPGMVNGLKAKPGKAPLTGSLFTRKIGEKVAVWQIITVLVAAIVVLSTFFVILNQPTGPAAIAIDGDFSDWDGIANYDFSLLPAGTMQGVTSAKTCTYADKLLLFANLDDTLLTSAAGATALYFFVDVDADFMTGYYIANGGCKIGADWYAKLVKYQDESVISSTSATFSATSDQNDWNGWSNALSFRWMLTGRQMEMSLSSNLMQSLDSPIVQIVAIKDREYMSPPLSSKGTIIAIQNPLVSGQVITSASQSIMNLSVLLIGCPGNSWSVTPELLIQFGGSIPLEPMQVSDSGWSQREIAAEIPGLTTGNGYVCSVAILSDEFEGPVQILGNPAKGYYVSMPDNMAVDGLFADWTNKTVIDQDPIIINNPDINIQEFGAASEDQQHYFFVRVAGEMLGGSDVPELQIKSSPGPPGPPTIRIELKGEDILEAYIDKDPGSSTGKMITAGNLTIFADYLVEIRGRNGIIETKYVKEWSSSSSAWVVIGGLQAIVVGKAIEFSVGKSLLGNLSDSETIFFATDWKDKSDYSLVGDMLKDPFRVNLIGEIWRSLDGTAWASMPD
ncbi:MAG: hypothetical protein OEV21_07995, partial [Thermoplasmata archaeon]|nr:hypothetical protein [Thermoplasmata archaeon]